MESRDNVVGTHANPTQILRSRYALLVRKNTRFSYYNLP